MKTANENRFPFLTVAAALIAKLVLKGPARYTIEKR